MLSSRLFPAESLPEIWRVYSVYTEMETLIRSPEKQLHTFYRTVD